MLSLRRALREGCLVGRDIVVTVASVFHRHADGGACRVTLAVTHGRARPVFHTVRYDERVPLPCGGDVLAESLSGRAARMTFDVPKEIGITRLERLGAVVGKAVG
jgi:sRNA-binding carbon storage regulator CsrA